MGQSAFGDVALELGWERYPLRDGTYMFRIGDRIATISPFERKLPNATMVDLGEMVYSDEMIAAIDHVFGTPSDWGRLAKNWRPTRATLRTVDAASVGPLLRGVIDWAVSVDRQEKLDYLAGLEGELDPATAVRHLVALALLGKTAQLMRYMVRARTGKIASLSLAIDEDMVQRALDLTTARQQPVG